MPKTSLPEDMGNGNALVPDLDEKSIGKIIGISLPRMTVARRRMAEWPNAGVTTERRHPGRRNLASARVRRTADNQMLARSGYSRLTGEIRGGPSSGADTSSVG